ncbi:MAG: MBL fold metallo-hydrolase [Hyphomicrobium zavarzinii]|jgi:phosphoribosyl 1,2-cyclic phosphate phosphodiesterase|uniref:MBL fold metallo-hydrolase n=1 Tax=Hyphomicrobium TaxID=81 RepID=UPI0003778E15|nr:MULTISPECIES: MBL fold metallo-hydrolase [Hyphomicrobium]MBL8847004.1 MBL fold metallo-hydrolase [Hyphomicrobium zavarzinii]WBT36469.1 MBL fold metallo-hydrolase [Hyphomicrobium sp. DMF-1]HML44347.1 MBL fold metallo-hydrolase [Hyphomicrobium zavarzinii]
MSLRLTILGCGSSGGVPRIGAMWGRCDPQNPRNRRRRCAMLVERRGPGGVTSILIDTPPDLREQLLSVRADALDAVLFTHDHADHTHGIDDLRMVAYAMKSRVPCYFDPVTRESLVTRFAYCFETPAGSTYPPILVPKTLTPGEMISVEGAGGPIDVLPIRQFHGDIESLAFRFGSVAYSPDVSALPLDSVALLEDLDLWIVDALRYTPHPSHFSVKEALEHIARLRAKRAILTHMTGDLDYEALRRELPANVEPAYDNMVIEV